MKNQFDAITRVLAICFSTFAMMTFTAGGTDAQEGKAFSAAVSPSSANPNTEKAGKIADGRVVDG